jgi:hypothetical protein
MQIGVRRYWNLLIICDYGVEKTTMTKQKFEKTFFDSIES